MNQLRRSSSGFALLAALPWAIAAVALVVAAASRFGGSGDSSTPSHEASDPAELKTLRLALATATAENSALRGELDRLISRGGSPAPAAAPVPAAPATASAGALSDEAKKQMSDRISESLSRAAAGDQESARDGAMALMQLLQKGPEAMEALKSAYLQTGDPKARMMMLPTMLFGGGEGARDFVVDQAQVEQDPELRRALLSQAARFATPKYAESLKGSFLEIISGDEDSGYRAAAIQGLRYAKGDDVQEALMGAVSDPSEEVRLAAIENLSNRPAFRAQLEEALERETSPRVREIGECRLLLTRGGGPRG